MPHAKGAGGIIPGLEEAQQGLVPRPTQQASVLESQYPAFRDAVRKMRQAGMPEGLIAELLSNAELTLKQKYSGRLSDQEITRDVIGRKPDIAQQFLATATKATGLGFLQDPQAAEAAEQAGGLPRFAGQVAGTLPLLTGVQGLISRIPALAARPILGGAAAGAAFGAGEPLLRGEEPTLGGTLGTAALFAAFGAFAGKRRALPGTKPPPSE
ncbi:MAG TPA: hypothetical protein VJA25_09320, partial [Dehalococcoidia bacterium]|nr:hypothetical protein [Dehalococcoidia bacterium]